MTKALIDILESFKYPVFRQGSLSDSDPYPETFITFWCNASPDHSHYDDHEYGTAWDFGVYVYSAIPNTCYTLTAEIRTALKAAGWIVPSQGFDVTSDEASHIGRGLDCYYLDAPDVKSGT